MINLQVRGGKAGEKEIREFNLRNSPVSSKSRPKINQLKSEWEHYASEINLCHRKGIY